MKLIRYVDATMDEYLGIRDGSLRRIIRCGRLSDEIKKDTFLLVMAPKDSRLTAVMTRVVDVHRTCAPIMPRQSSAVMNVLELSIEY